jgi:hypothetical protein
VPEVPKNNIILALALYIALLLVSCGAPPQEKSAPAEQRFSQEHVSGLFSLMLQTSRKEITAAGDIELVLEAAAPENTGVEFQEFAAALGDFTLRDKQFSTPRLTSSGKTALIVHRAVYLLEPYLPGTYSIPAISVTFRDRESGRELSLLRTETLEIPVRSLLDANAETTDIRDISPPLSLGPERVFQLTPLGLALIFAALAAVISLFLQKKKKKRVIAPVVLPPDEVALQELEELERDDLLGRGEVQVFHERISAILRRYIENRFGLKAPERTTEEFLTELSRSQSTAGALLGSHKTVLTDFLTQCDLVKFARYEPDRTASERTVEICRKFVEKTRARVRSEDEKERTEEGKNLQEK